MDRLDELDVLVAILDAGSLNGAARKLRRSASAVTRALGALEARVGARLVERTTRRLAPTDAGLRMGELARRMLADYDQALHADEQAPLRGKLRITAPYVFGRKHVTPAVIEFLDLHPGVQIELVLNDRNVDLIEQGLDLAVRIGPLPDTGMVARPVGTVRPVIVASPAYVARAGMPLTPHELVRHDVVFSSAASRAQEWRFRVEGQDLAVKLDARLSVNDVDAVLMAVLAGRGIGRALSYQVAEHLAEGRLLRLLQAYEPAPLPVQLLMQSARYRTPRLRACVDFLVQRLGALPVLQQA
ncbi:MAG: LysR family transcriptional regulator [Gammaproteobacteria bacterium]